MSKSSSYTCRPNLNLILSHVFFPLLLWDLVQFLHNRQGRNTIIPRRLFPVSPWIQSSRWQCWVLILLWPGIIDWSPLNSQQPCILDCSPVILSDLDLHCICASCTVTLDISGIAFESVLHGPLHGSLFAAINQFSASSYKMHWTCESSGLTCKSRGSGQGSSLLLALGPK